MLERYRNDERIVQINTFNATSSKASGDRYFFTRYPICWGWATWARAWRHIDFEMKIWKQEREKIFHRFGLWEGLIHYWRWNRNYWVLKNGGKSSIWDYQWDIYVSLKNKLCVIPEVNLIKNIGFMEGTHCSCGDKTLEQVCHGQLQFPLKHPETVCVDSVREAAYSSYFVCGFLHRRFDKIWKFLYRKS